MWAPRTAVAAAPSSEPSALRRLGVIAGTVAVVLVAWWASLFATSEGLDADQQVIVYRAVDLLEEKGFAKEVFALRNVARFRSTDNWWNLYNEHYQAYAATNFPFEIVTIYPWFFDLPKDDIERAVILLHEAQHLMGADEETALRRVWALKAPPGLDRRDLRAQQGVEEHARVDPDERPRPLHLQGSGDRLHSLNLEAGGGLGPEELEGKTPGPIGY